ncbi:MAG: hypothetical protein O7E52_12330 [Candidatus Poribacteria bacterium]|nr:hypothetical protein [Candidatus Poribacteria bacterium]
MLFNRIRAVEYMQRYGVDVLVATSPVNITYFSDYACWLDPLFKEYEELRRRRIIVLDESANLKAELKDLAQKLDNERLARVAEEL